jgi:hypothetical protein
MDLTARAISSQSSDLPHSDVFLLCDRAAERRVLLPHAQTPIFTVESPEGRSSMRNPYDACDGGPSQAVYSGRP